MYLYRRCVYKNYYVVILQCCIYNNGIKKWKFDEFSISQLSNILRNLLYSHSSFLEFWV